MDTANILQQIVSLNEDVKNNKPAARESMLVAAQALVTSLQTTSEFVSSIGYTEPARHACLRIALDLKIFETLAQHQMNDGADASQIAKVTGADEGLIARVLRHLAATNVIAEPAQGKFANTKLSTELTDTRFQGGILFNYDVLLPSFSQMLSYLSKTHFKEPINPTDGPFQYAHNTQATLFQWLAQHPTYLKAFGSYMGARRESKESWYASTFYPVHAQLIDGFHTGDVNAPFLVDVGGGKGHDLLTLHAAFPSLPGQLVLQDKPEVISSINPPLPLPTFKSMSHDFFTPQPIKAARAYFLHSVIHNWNDEDCIKILEALKPALKPGYSKVLVHDLIVPDKGATWEVTGMDFVMMAALSIKERTETDFRRLFEAAGLTIEKIWVYEPGTEVIIEASLPALEN